MHSALEHTTVAAATSRQKWLLHAFRGFVSQLNPNYCRPPHPPEDLPNSRCGGARTRCGRCGCAAPARWKLCIYTGAFGIGHLATQLQICSSLFRLTFTDTFGCARMYDSFQHESPEFYVCIVHIHAIHGSIPDMTDLDLLGPSHVSCRTALNDCIIQT